LEALNRASSCREAIEETLNKTDAYSEYKKVMNKMNDTCFKKIN